MSVLLAAINRARQARGNDDSGILIECPDGLVVGATIDAHGRESGGEFVPCGRQVSYRGACPRCGSRSWAPAGPDESTPVDLKAKREERAARNILRLVGGMD